MQSTSRYRELIVMDAVHNKQPKRLQQSIQFIRCMISMFFLTFVISELCCMTTFLPVSKETYTIFLCILSKQLLCEYVYKADNKKPQATIFRGFCQGHKKDFLPKCIENHFLHNRHIRHRFYYFKYLVYYSVYRISITVLR